MEEGCRCITPENMLYLRDEEEGKQRQAGQRRTDGRSPPHSSTAFSSTHQHFSGTCLQAQKELVGGVVNLFPMYTLFDKGI